MVNNQSFVALEKIPSKSAAHSFRRAMNKYNDLHYSIGLEETQARVEKSLELICTYNRGEGCMIMEVENLRRGGFARNSRQANKSSYPITRGKYVLDVEEVSEDAIKQLAVQSSFPLIWDKKDRFTTQNLELTSSKSNFFSHPGSYKIMKYKLRIMVNQKGGFY